MEVFLAALKAKGIRSKVLREKLGKALGPSCYPATQRAAGHLPSSAGPLSKNNFIFLFFIGRAKRAPHWGVQSRFRVIYVIVIPWLRGIIVDNCPDSRGRSPSERAVSVR